MEILNQIYYEFLEAWLPPPDVKLSEWADEFAYLSLESSHQAGKWKSFPYQRGIMDAITDPNVETITVIKSARVGYTKILNHTIGYHVHQDPTPILIVQPTLDDASGYSKEEITPMFRDTPVLYGLVAEPKSRDGDNTITKKFFSGGHLSIIGANSARGFRRISARIIMFDEVDGYPPTAGQEGDQITLGSRRSEWFWNRKIILGSTPTVKNISRIEDSFEQSDKRYFFVPCPYCGEFQVLKWSQIKWPEKKPEAAYYVCAFCEQKIPHSRKKDMVEAGEWRATAPFRGHAGFHIWAAYSYAPNAVWGKLALEREESEGDIEKLRTFINTVLGETWEEKGTQPDWVSLKKSADPYEMLTVPQGGLFLSAGVDVQENRLALIIRAWGRAQESWLIFWGEIYGDPLQEEVWTELDGFVERGYRHTSGIDLYIMSMAVDSGGRSTTQAVYNYCRTRAPRAIAIKGASQSGKPVIGRPSKQDVDYYGTFYENGVRLWPIGTDTAKSIIYSRLSLNEPGPGWLHTPQGTEDEYYMQLTAEKSVRRYVKGFPKYEWVKVGPRNEALDCEVYCMAAALRAGMAQVDWDKLEMNLQKPANKEESKSTPKNHQSWIPPKPNWLKGK